MAKSLTSKRPTELFLACARRACKGPLVPFYANTAPSPASRPRVSRYGTYYPKAYATFVRECQEQFAQAKGRVNAAAGAPLVVLCEIIVERPKTTSRRKPRGDFDNYVKAPLDALTKAGVWNDDDDVAVGVVTKRFTRPGEAPGTVLHVGELKWQD